MRFFAAIIALLLSAALPARAQHQHSPYAGAEHREIKALSQDVLHGLLNGEGLGYAKAAELNGTPGPKHVLELADKLGLRPQQVERTRAIYEEMRVAAVKLGERLVEVERRIDMAFAAGTIRRAELASLTAQSARLEGELRLTHLQAHLEMLQVLEPPQVRRYNELRGYRRGP
jgi:Spy/CpxP family protein refolding chaperone